MDYRPLALPLSTVTQTSFQLFTPDEVRRVSVCNVTNVEALDRSKMPIKGGLYDPAMGPLDPLRQAMAHCCALCSVFIASYRSLSTAAALPAVSPTTSVPVTLGTLSCRCLCTLSLALPTLPLSLVSSLPLKLSLQLPPAFLQRLVPPAAYHVPQVLPLQGDRPAAPF